MTTAALTPNASLVSVAELVGRPVVNASGDQIGRLTDVVVRWDEDTYPAVVGLVLKIGGRRTFLHAHDVAHIGHDRVEVASPRVVMEEFERRPGEVLLAADVIDHQLVDVDGARVVRAADLYLADLGSMRLVAVDVGLKALARRMMPGRRRSAVQPAVVLDWAGVQPVDEPGGRLTLRSSAVNLRRLHPAELADLLDDLGRSERHALLSHLGPDVAADVLEEASPSYVTELLLAHPLDRAAELLLAMEPDEAAEAIRAIDEPRRSELLAQLEGDAAERLRTLAGHHPVSAGGNMTSRLALVHRGDRVDDVREQLRLDPTAWAGLDAVVVVDDDGILVDDLGVAELFLADPEAVLDSMIGPPLPIVVHVADPLEKVIERFIDGRCSSVVVVDDARRPVGRILADDLIDALMPGRDRGERRAHI
jgi:sporulation protein YlmC with PRC-barrel domain/CBS domain-containing protein